MLPNPLIRLRGITTWLLLCRSSNQTATIIGPTKLKGTEVVATDLRAGAAMVAAGLKAEGTTIITNAEHILRGYEQIVEKLTAVGAKIRIKEI